MSEENSALTATLKAGQGYDAPWLVVRADSPEDLRNRLNSVLNGDLASLVSQAAIGLQSGYSATKTLGAQPVTVVEDAPWHITVPAPVIPLPAQSTPAPAPTPTAPQGQRQESDKWGNVYTWNVPGAETCPHGARILKQGNKKDGTRYSAYICPQVDKFYRVQTDCKPVYAN